MQLSFTLPTSLKINRKTDIDFVFKQPSIKHGNTYFLILARENQLGFARLGLIVAKKNLKKAVDRNKVKRISREFFRLHQHLIKGYDCIVLTRPQLKILVKENSGKNPSKSINTELRNTWYGALQKISKKLSKVAQISDGVVSDSVVVESRYGLMPVQAKLEL